MGNKNIAKAFWFGTMKYVVAISLIIGIAYGASMYDTVKGLVTGASSSYEEGSEYGEKKCYPTFETKYRKQCEDYNERCVVLPIAKNARMWAQRDAKQSKHPDMKGSVMM